MSAVENALTAVRVRTFTRHVGLEQLEDMVAEQPRVYVDVRWLSGLSVRSICYGSDP